MTTAACLYMHAWHVLTGERRDRGQVDEVPGGAWHDAGDEEAGVGVGARPEPRRTAGQLAGGGDEDDEQSGEDKALRRHYIVSLLDLLCGAKLRSC